MRHRFLTLAFLSGLAAACSTDPATQTSYPAPSAAAPAPTEVPADSAASVSAPSPASTAAAPTMLARLQGKWQSTDDALDVIELHGHRYTDYYNQERLSSKEFILDRACPGEPGAGAPDDNEAYLVIPAEDMCWRIAAVDATSLELEYVAGGKVLKYSRVP